MIPLYTESSESLNSRKQLGCGLEHCVFCNQKTSTWHENTNSPICIKCAKIKKIKDIPEDNGQTIRANKRKGDFDREDSVRAN